MHWKPNVSQVYWELSFSSYITMYDPIEGTADAASL